MSVNPVADLQKRIDAQRRQCRYLQSDLEFPHNLDRTIKEQQEKLSKLPSELDTQIEFLRREATALPATVDKEIDAARVHLQTLIDTREERINAIEARLSSAIADKGQTIDLERIKLATLKERRANTKEQYIAATEVLNTLVAKMKRLENSEAIQKAKSLQQQLAELEAMLPPALRGKSIEEIQAALSGEGENDE